MSRRQSRLLRWRRRPISGLVLALALLGTACSGGGGGGQATGAVPNPGVLVVTDDDEPKILDPAQVPSDDVAASIIFEVYDRLLDIPANSSSPAPSLATKVPSLDNGLLSKDGLTYTFPIRKGVTFQDGSKLTAKDVKFSWDRVIKMALPEGQADLFANVKDTRVVDDYTFQVTLKAVDVTFLSTTVISMPASIVSEKVVNANGGVVAGKPNNWMASNMVGTGPYKLTEWARGDHISLGIFKKYWGTPAHLPVRLLVLIKDQPPGLQAKKYDVIGLVPQRIPEVAHMDDAVINRKAMGLQMDEIGFNMKIDPATLPKGDTIPADFFQDPRIRQAFNYSFPYQKFIKGILNGNATRSSFVLPVGIPGYDPKAPIYKTDPAKAKQLFQETGWWDRGFTVSLLVDGTNGTFNGAALAMKDGIESLNPKFHVHVLGVAESRFDELMTHNPIPAAMWSYTSPGLGSAGAYLHDMAEPNGTWGKVAGFSKGYTDPAQIQKLISQAQGTLDEKARAARYSELQRVLYEQAMWVIPAQEGFPAAYGDWMKPVVVNPMWPRPGFRYALYDKKSGG